MIYRHPACRRDACGCRVERVGKDEPLGSKIGPHLRVKAIYLCNVIRISYRQVPEAIYERLGIHFIPAALLDFEGHLAQRFDVVVDAIAKKIATSDGAIHGRHQLRAIS